LGFDFLTEGLYKPISKFLFITSYIFIQDCQT